MSWYYVQNGERQGPVEASAIKELISTKTLGHEDYVWTKGFEDWKKIKDVSELSVETISDLPGTASLPEINDVYGLLEGDYDTNIFFTRIGLDRGLPPVDYGPFNLSMLKQLKNEGRINDKTLIFYKGMTDWMMLGDFSDYQTVFGELPPLIEEKDRRFHSRKPFIARLFFHNNQDLYEGICRDISIGGMQVLLDHFPGVVGDTISLNVHPENTDYHFIAQGEVVRVLEGGQGFSFRFTDLNPEAQKRINDYLSERE